MLYLLYTSGTTAKPKGIVHTTAGYLAGVATTHKLIFDVKDDDVYWCAADIGWVTGHSYIVFAPLANGTTGVMYEGTPDFPDKDRWWSIIEKYKVSILYCAPTAIRTFMKWGAEYPAKHNMSSLRLLGSVGEPINPEAWLWYQETIGGGRCPIVDTWWMTETGMILITPLPGLTTTKPGSATFPFPGVAADVVDEDWKSVSLRGGNEGSEELSKELREHVVKAIGSIARPKTIMFTPELPKTRSGKIMRRLLRDIANGTPLGDTTTLADATVVESIRTASATGKDD